MHRPHVGHEALNLSVCLSIRLVQLYGAEKQEVATRNELKVGFKKVIILYCIHRVWCTIIM